MVVNIMIDENTININGNIVNLTLSWEDPSNNRYPMIHYTVTVSCSDGTCPPYFTIPDITTRNYDITNLIPMTTYTFSIVATNSFGSGEAGTLDYTTPGMYIRTQVYILLI